MAAGVPLSASPFGVFESTPVRLHARPQQTVGELKRALVEHGLRTDQHALLFDLEFLDDARTVGDYALPPHARLTVVPLAPGCPPAGCCCFTDLEAGALFFTRLFNALQALAMVAGALGTLFTALSSCRWFGRTRCPSAAPGASDVELALYARFVAGFVVSALVFAWNALELAIGVYGAARLRARDARGVYRFAWMQLALLVLAGLTNFGVTFPFYAWYVFCLKVLADRLRRERELGAPAPPGGAAGAPPPPPPPYATHV